MGGLLIVNDKSDWFGLSGPQFRWFFERVSEETDDVRVLGLCHFLQDAPYDTGFLESWDALPLARLADAVERVRDRIRTRGSEILTPAADVGWWVGKTDELLAMLRADPRLRDPD